MRKTAPPPPPGVTASSIKGRVDTSLTGPIAQAGTIALLAAPLAVMLIPPKNARGRRNPRRWLLGPVAVTGAVAWAIVGGIWFALGVAWRPFPEAVPAAIYVASAVALHAAMLAVVKPLATRRRTVAWTLPVALVAVVAALLQANICYQLYPTVASLDPTTIPDEVAYEDLKSVGQRDTGVVTTVRLNNSASGFAAREAHVYLPPAYFDRDRPKLPVIVVVAGVPGAPAQWFDEGLAGQALDSFASEHRGRAPVVVAVDANGETFKDTLCVDSPATGDKVATYLSRDVPAAVAGLFDVDRDPAKWAIAGLSRGGSCALQTAVANPGVYPTFLSMSPQKNLIDENLDETVRKYFKGDRAAYDAADPLTVLEKVGKPGGPERGPDIHGRFIAGLDDAEDRDAGRALSTAAHAAGIPVSYSELPGGHTWKVWSAGFRDSLPWLSARLGLTGEG